MDKPDTQVVPLFGNTHLPDVIHRLLIFHGRKDILSHKRLYDRGTGQAEVPPHLKPYASALVAKVEKYRFGNSLRGHLKLHSRRAGLKERIMQFFFADLR